MAKVSKAKTILKYYMRIKMQHPIQMYMYILVYIYIAFTIYTTNAFRLYIKLTFLGRPVVTLFSVYLSRLLLRFPDFIKV